MTRGITAIGMILFLLCACVATPRHRGSSDDASAPAPLEVPAAVAVPAIGGLF